MGKYQIKVDGEVRMNFSANFAQASCPIMLEGDSTPYQVADARHDSDRAARLLIDWCDSQGGSNVGEDEEYEVVPVEEKQLVGEWGNGYSVIEIWATDDDFDAVREAYDDIDDDDLNRNTALADVVTAGGELIEQE